MRKFKFLMVCALTVIVMFSFATIVSAETNSVDCGNATFTYDENGNVTIDAYCVESSDYNKFLSYVGVDYDVKSIKFTDAVWHIGYGAFSNSWDTLQEIFIPLSMERIEGYIFGADHNVQIKYEGNEYWWYNEVDKEDYDEYYGDVEFCANGYANISYVAVEAYNGRIYSFVEFNFVEKNCVAEFSVYSYNEDGELELDNVETVDISAGTDYLEYDFEFACDGKEHLISVVLYDNLTNKTQWGEVSEQDFFAYDTTCVCEWLDVDVSNARLELYMDFLFVAEDCVASVEIYDYDENDDLLLNKEFSVDITKGTMNFRYEVPFIFDNESHLIKVSFYDDMTNKNELCEPVSKGFTTYREYKDFSYDYIDDETVKITGYTNTLEDRLYIPIKIADYTVTEIAENAFCGNENICEVLIPHTVEKIGDGAFDGCTYLERGHYTGTESQWAEIVIGENNDSLINVKISYNYLPYMDLGFRSYYQNDVLEVFAWVDECYRDCFAKIELVNLSKNETTVVYSEIKAGESGEKLISIPLSNYGETFSLYGSVVSADKTVYYVAPYEFEFFTPYNQGEIFLENDFEYYVTEDNEAVIVSYTSINNEIVIPDTLGGYPVVGLDSWCFSGSTMTSLSIGKNLKSIGYGTLSYCEWLENIEIDSENKNFIFENGVLYNADKTEILLYLLTNDATHYDMPESVEIIGAHAFEGAGNLESIELSSNLKRIERQGLGATGIKDELILPEGLEAIGSEALSSGFSKIHIPKSTNTIARDAFNWNWELTEITVDEENEKFTSVEGVLYNKNKTTLIKYPGNKSGQTFYIPDTVTEIYCNAFTNTLNLYKIVIPESVKMINERAFEESSVRMPFYLGLEDEFYDVLIGGYGQLWDDVVIGTKTTGSEYDWNGYERKYEITPEHTVFLGFSVKRSGYVDIPETLKEIPVDTIGKEAFKGQNEITTLWIPESIKSFDIYSSFEGLNGLERFDVDKNNAVLKTDSDGILYSKDGKQLIRFPASLQTYNGKYTITDDVEAVLPFAFSGASLDIIEIGKNVNAIGRYAFVNISGLKDIDVFNNESFASENGVLYTADMKTLIQYPRGKETPAFNVPNTVTNIAPDAFRNAWGLKTVTLPSELKNIGDYAFYDCENLEAIKIPDGVKELKPYTFFNCICLNKITIPESIENIGENAFKNCIGLDSVYFAGTEDQYDAIDIHETNTYLTKDKLVLLPLIKISSQSDSEVDFMVENASPDFCLLIAHHKNGVFEMLEKRYCTSEVQKIVLGSNFDPLKDTVEIMVWEDVSNLPPLCNSVTIGQ